LTLDGNIFCCKIESDEVYLVDCINYSGWAGVVADVNTGGCLDLQKRPMGSAWQTVNANANGVVRGGSWVMGH
jgi:hypothetical protein